MLDVIFTFNSFRDISSKKCIPGHIRGGCLGVSKLTSSEKKELGMYTVKVVKLGKEVI